MQLVRSIVIWAVLAAVGQAATLGVPLTDSAFRFAGQFAQGQINSLNGYKLWVGRDSRIEFKATGTGVTMSIVAVATQPTLRVSVDGAAFSNLTLGSAGVRTDVTLSTGLSDAEHTYVVEHSSGTQANAGVEIAGGITITGAAPAIAAPDGYSTARYEPAGFPMAAVSRYPGNGRAIQATGYNNIMALQTPDASIKFRGNPTSIKAWVLHGGRYRVYQDGTPLAAAANISSGGSSRYGWDTLASGLDGADHEYEIVNASANLALNIYELMLIGGDITTRPANKYKLVVIGDSMTAGQGTSDSTQAFGRRLAAATNRTVVNWGVSSSRVTTFQGFGTASMGQRIGDFMRFDSSENVDEIIILYGHNDAVNQAALTDFYAEYRRMVEMLMAAFPTANIRCSAILPTTASITPITRADYIAEIADVVTDIADARVTHITMETTDMTPNYNATAGQDTTDGVHPNSSGYDKVVARYGALLSTAPDIVDVDFPFRPQIIISQLDRPTARQKKHFYTYGVYAIAP